MTLPAHLAVIMDGNGRWATRRGLPRTEGHKRGTESARRLVEHCRDIGIRHVTLYTFSRENWARPMEEVSFLFSLMADFITKEIPRMHARGIRLRVLGELADVPFGARQVIQYGIKKTAGNTDLTLNLALNYSGREEILRAARSLIRDGLSPEEITEEAFSARLYTAGQPDPDLVVRTSGEHRISNYLLFQSAYAEFYFTDTLWPDFDEAELDKALADFASRQRRFGRTGEQAAKGD